MRYKSRREARAALRDKPVFAAIDPGVDYLAWAIFDTGHLTRAELRRDDLCCAGVSFGVIEAPSRAFDDVRESDIFDLAIAAGEIGRGFRHRLYVTPQTWKGQVPKAIHQRAHIWPKLSETERALLPTKKTELKHVLDAVGIGLWYLGRL